MKFYLVTIVGLFRMQMGILETRTAETLAGAVTPLTGVLPLGQQPMLVQ